MHRASVLGLAVLAAMEISCRWTPLILPEPVRALDEKSETRAAILLGMVNRGWFVEDERPGQILATLQRRRHAARVWIDYGGPQITFRYGGSEGMNCKPIGDSCRSIHRSYVRWTRNLGMDISRQLTLQRVLRSPPAVATSP